jgi:hypothetical protein
MTAHTLEAPKGWPSPHAVDFAAKISANVTIDPVFAGRCVHLNAVGEFEMGVPDTAPAGGKIYMPIWLFQNSDDPDVQNDGGITGSEEDEPGGWMAVAPTGKIMGLVGAGAYELETTEFEPESSLGSTYEPNHALTATNSNSNAVTGGRMTKGTPYTHPIVGIVSRAVFVNSHRKNALAFWPYVLLPTA